MEENKKTNRKEFWQIIFPLIIGSLMILGLAIWTVIAAVNGAEINQHANVSTVLLLIPFMFFSLIPLAIIGLTAYGITYLKKVLPKYTQKGQEIASLVAEKTRDFADKAATPIFSVESFWVTLRVLFRR